MSCFLSVPFFSSFSAPFRLLFQYVLKFLMNIESGNKITSLLIIRWLYCIRHFPDIMDTLFIIFRHCFRSRIWSAVSTWTPKNNKLLILIIHHFCYRHICRSDQFTFCQNAFLVKIYFVCRNSFKGIDRTPLFSSIPITIYPPPQLSRSLAKAQTVFREVSASHVSLNSICAHSTTSPESNVFIFVGIAINFTPFLN